jgi:methionyl aminopeptidase
MLYLKTDEEVGLLKESNMLVSRTLAEMASLIKPGITTLYLDKIAETFIRDNKGIPAFKGYNGFPNTLCTSVNDEVVHGIPSGYVLKEGDILSIDCGVILNDYYGDSAYTFSVGKIEDRTRQLLDYTLASLEEGVKAAIEGNRIGDISYAVQTKAESGGFSVVRELVGHGLGRKLHEAPEVPNYGRRGTGPKLEKGLVICIEPMINIGLKDTMQMRDGWTIKTVDGKPSAHFEYAVAVDKGKADVLTTFKFIEDVLNKMYLYG